MFTCKHWCRYGRKRGTFCQNAWHHVADFANSGVAGLLPPHLRGAADEGPARALGEGPDAARRFTAGAPAFVPMLFILDI